MADICKASTEALLAAAIAFDEAEKERIAGINIYRAVQEPNAEA